jgi:hypothetical protein
MKTFSLSLVLIVLFTGFVNPENEENKASAPLLPPTGCYIALTPSMFLHVTDNDPDGVGHIGELANNQDFATGDPSAEGTISGGEGQHWGYPWNGQSDEGYIDLGADYDISAIYILQGWGAGTLTISEGIPGSETLQITHNGISSQPNWVGYTQAFTARYITFNRDANIKVHEIAICGTPSGGGCAYTLISNTNNIICDNNGTPSDPSDDTFTFDLNVSRSDGQTTGSWETGTQNSPYGTPLSMGPYPISGGDLNLEIQDLNDATCDTIYQSVIAPASCSNGGGNCTYTIQYNVNNKVCNNNGTDSDPTDDTFTFQLTVSRDDNMTSGSWTADVGGTPYSGTYGDSVMVSAFPISGGTVSITIDDTNDATCTQVNTSVTAPATCSNGGGGGNAWVNGTDENVNIHRFGKVGIGTSSFGNDPDTYLLVKGTIRAEHMKVELCASGGWCDHVFHPEYDLLSLEAVQAHIQDKRHLPGVPSEASLEEEGQIDLGNMTVIQQEKIEELFLYMIQLNEKVKHLEGEIKMLKEENTSLKVKQIED